MHVAAHSCLKECLTNSMSTTSYSRSLSFWRYIACHVLLHHLLSFSFSLHFSLHGDFLVVVAAFRIVLQLFSPLSSYDWFVSFLFSLYNTGIPQGAGAAALGHRQNARWERRSHSRHQQTLKVVCVSVCLCVWVCLWWRRTNHLSLSLSFLAYTPSTIYIIHKI